MKISKDARKTARGLLALSIRDGKLDRDTVGTISDYLLSAKPRSYVQILKELARLIRLELSKCHVTVESAAPLEDAAAASILSDIKKRFSGDLTSDFCVNPALLGGLRIQVGNDVWDGTVKARLDQLKQRLQ